jgi:hypothetical protein
MDQNNPMQENQVNNIPPVVQNTNTVPTSPVSAGTNKPDSKKVLIIVITIVVLVIAAIGGYFIFSNNSKSKVVTNSQPATPKTLSPADMSKPIVASEKDYDYYLSQVLPVASFVSQGFTAASPAVVKMGDYGDLNVGLPLIPNINLSDGAIIVNFDSIKDKTGKEILDKENSFETDPFFTHLSDKQIYSDPVVYIGGTRNPSLISGAQGSDIATMSGKIILNLPVNMYVAELTSSDIGKTIKTTNGSLLLKSINATKDDSGADITNIVFNYTGFENKIYYVGAYDANDSLLNVHSQDFTFPSTNNSYGSQDYTMTISGSAQKFVFSESTSQIVKNISFEINNAQPTIGTEAPATPATPATDNSNKTPAVQSQSTSAMGPKDTYIKYIGLLESADTMEDFMNAALPYIYFATPADQASAIAQTKAMSAKDQATSLAQSKEFMKITPDTKITETISGNNATLDIVNSYGFKSSINMILDGGAWKVK